MFFFSIFTAYKLLSMASSYEKYQKRKLISSYFSVILSIFLVLFLLGSLSLFILNSNKISDTFRENIPMSIFISDQASAQEITNFQKTLEEAPYIKDVSFISKEAAAQSQEAVLGENFLEFLGHNPLENSFDIHLNGTYVYLDSITKIEKDFQTHKFVTDITYDKQLVDLVNDNIQKITFWVLVASGILAVISMLLINSSLRLLIFSSRFIIKTMQMVGATKAFIRRPFVWHSMKLGIIGSLLAIGGIVALSHYLDTKFPDLNIGLAENYLPIALVCMGILFTGIIITSISTYFATQKFLNLKSDQLY